MTKRVGFACKISRLDPKKGILAIPEYNSRSTTVAWLNRQKRDVAVEKLWELTKHNIEAARRAVEYVGNLEEGLRLFRLGSDILPVYTEPNWSWFWRQPDVRAYCEREFRNVGNLARKMGLRLSFHPGQYCCIVSDNQDVVTRSLEELEYHSDMIRWMGFGSNKLDFKLNIHLSGRGGVDAFDAAWSRMSTETRNCLTLENDEYQIGLDDLIYLKDKVGIVLDIHHHLIREHEYIQSDDNRIKHIEDSWAGRRPVIHYSVSREEYVNASHHTDLPNIEQMIREGAKKQHLRAHSDYMWHDAVNKWAMTHWSWADVLVESKAKNLASIPLYNQWTREAQS